MKPSLCTAVVLGSALSLAAGSMAQAEPLIWTEIIHDGMNAGPIADERRNRQNNNQLGVGSEQAVLTYLPNAVGGPTVLVVSIGSYRDLPEGPPANRIQGLCASYRLDPLLGPQQRALRYVTANNGDRRRNSHRPSVTGIWNGTAALMELGYAPNNHTQVYQQVLGPNCEVLSQQTRILAQNNDNCTTRDYNNMVVLSDSPTRTRLGGAAQCNGNGRDNGYAYGVNVDKNAEGRGEIAREFLVEVEREVDIWRPSVSATGQPDRMALCGAVGDARPANRGARCMLINTEVGIPNNQRILWREYVMRRDGRIYAMNPLLAPVLDAEGKATDELYLAWVRADLRNRQRKAKGITNVLFTSIRATDSGLDILATPTTSMTTAADSSHPGLCSTRWGAEAESRAVLLQGSIVGSTTGAGRAGIVAWDTTARTLTREKEFVYADSADTGWLSNFYGQNPHTQGRNFLNCLGSVRNPGYGVNNGFMAEVAEFLVITSEGRYLQANGMPEDKLSLRLHFVPAVVPDVQPDPDPIPDPDEDEDQPDPENPVEPDPGIGGTPSMSGCSTSSSSTGLGFLALLSLALFGITRRRRWS